MKKIDAIFNSVKERYGEFSVERVENMLKTGGHERQPAQKDAKMIMPGLTQRAWHDPYEHAEIAPVVQAFEAGHPAIKAEFEKAWRDASDEFTNYEHFLMTKPEWQALYLFFQGSLVEKSSETVPTAYGILKNDAIDKGVFCPLLEAHFSTLLPGTGVPSHTDLWNFTINLHVAVDIPEKCGIRVVDETREWEEGKCLLFDYSFEHESWNNGDRPRTCLLVDLWHPDTTPPEREALMGLVPQIRRFGGLG
ncbi:aspartyl/asparaginyl beta-hydroxylase domain-containing protein [Amycolatopsis sp. NBC_00345]|uniref:aspartyl/asparaginyl beta-hydroxylase domain-containing protein n=1 Tax=Amycolatopsis sp. NBC_00345 TaxID=2975955 RepID=UPI002E26E9F9